MGPGESGKNLVGCNTSINSSEASCQLQSQVGTVTDQLWNQRRPFLSFHWKSMEELPLESRGFFKFKMGNVSMNKCEFWELLPSRKELLEGSVVLYRVSAGFDRVFRQCPDLAAGGKVIESRRKEQKSGPTERHRKRAPHAKDSQSWPIAVKRPTLDDGRRGKSNKKTHTATQNKRITTCWWRLMREPLFFHGLAKFCQHSVAFSFHLANSFAMTYRRRLRVEGCPSNFIRFLRWFLRLDSFCELIYGSTGRTWLFSFCCQFYWVLPSRSLFFQ